MGLLSMNLSVTIKVARDVGNDFFKSKNNQISTITMNVQIARALWRKIELYKNSFIFLNRLSIWLKFLFLFFQFFSLPLIFGSRVGSRYAVKCHILRRQPPRKVEVCILPCSKFYARVVISQFIYFHNIYLQIDNIITSSLFLYYRETKVLTKPRKLKVFPLLDRTLIQ